MIWPCLLLLLLLQTNFLLSIRTTSINKNKSSRFVWMTEKKRWNSIRYEKKYHSMLFFFNFDYFYSYRKKSKIFIASSIEESDWTIWSSFIESNLKFNQFLNNSTDGFGLTNPSHRRSLVQLISFRRTVSNRFRKQLIKPFFPIDHIKQLLNEKKNFLFDFISLTILYRSLNDISQLPSRYIKRKIYLEESINNILEIFFSLIFFEKVSLALSKWNIFLFLFPTMYIRS